MLLIIVDELLNPMLADVRDLVQSIVPFERSGHGHHPHPRCRDGAGEGGGGGGGGGGAGGAGGAWSTTK